MYDNLQYKILLFFILLWPLNLPAVIINNESLIDTFSINYYYDESDALEIEEIITLKAFKVIHNNTNLGRTYHTNWFHVPFINKSDAVQTRIIVFSENFTDRFDFYEFDEDLVFQNKSSMASNVPIEKKAIHDNLAPYQITLQPRQTKHLYMAVKTSVGYLGTCQIYKPANYYKSRELKNYFYVFIYSVMFAFLTYNFIIYMYTKDTLHIYYILYIIFVNGWISLQTGFVYIFIPLEYLPLIYLSIPLSYLMFIIFSQKLLSKELATDFKTNTFTIYKILYILSAILFSINLQIGTIFFYIIHISLLVPMYFIIKHVHSKIRLYAVASSLFILSSTLLPLHSFNIIPYSFLMRNAVLLGFIIEVIFFSVVMANRINVLKQQKVTLAEELLQYQKKENILLQTKVNEQTDKITMLFQELQHRVKNNFQFILTFLWLQKKSTSSPQTLQALEQIQNRIHAIANSHEVLCKNNTITSFKVYFEKLLHSFENSSDTVIIEENIEDIRLSFDDTLSLGLILNELLTNSLKYAFKTTAQPLIHIHCTKQEDTYLFIYEDNGSGCDQKLLETSTGLGYQLVKKLVSALTQSTLEVDSHKKFKVSITFKEMVYHDS